MARKLIHRVNRDISLSDIIHNNSDARIVHSELTDILHDNSDATKIMIEDIGRWDYSEFVLQFYTYEDDDEFTIRTAREKAIREKEKRAKDKRDQTKREKELKMLAALKEKYENG